LESKKAYDLAEEVNRTSEDTQVVLRKATVNLQRYITLIVVMAYINETHFDDFLPTYSTWCKKHSEFSTHLSFPTFSGLFFFFLYRH